MIVHAKVSKLYQYLHDDEFSRVMRHVEAASEEGLDVFTLEVDRLDDGVRLDLLAAFEAMGYVVIYDNEGETFDVSIADD
jgi:hypothetical protein